MKKHLKSTPTAVLISPQFLSVDQVIMIRKDELNMKKTYNMPEYELLMLEDEDILTASFDISDPDEEVTLPFV